MGGGKKSTERIVSRAAAVHGSVVYINPWELHKMYSCHIIMYPKEQVWLLCLITAISGSVLSFLMILSQVDTKMDGLNGTNNLIVNDQMRQ